MKRQDVQVGGLYMTKVSGKLVTVEIKEDRGMYASFKPYAYGSKYVNKHCGWTAVNTQTGRTIHIRSAARLRVPVIKATPASSQYL